MGQFGSFLAIFGPFCGIFGQICGKFNFFAGELGSGSLLLECMHLDQPDLILEIRQSQRAPKLLAYHIFNVSSVKANYRNIFENISNISLSPKDNSHVSNIRELPPGLFLVGGWGECPDGVGIKSP